MPIDIVYTLITLVLVFIISNLLKVGHEKKAIGTPEFVFWNAITIAAIFIL